MKQRKHEGYFFVRLPDTFRAPLEQVAAEELRGIGSAAQALLSDGLKMRGVRIEPRRAA